MQSIDAALFMFAPLMALLFLGVPVAFALITVAAVFGLWHFGDSVVHLFVGKVQEIAASHALAAAPLFVFMGAMLERSGTAERLFEVIHMWTRRLPGGWPSARSSCACFLPRRAASSAQPRPS